MTVEIGYAIVWFFCAVACVIVGVQSMRTNRFISREPIGIALLACVVMWVSWMTSDRVYSERLLYAAIAFSVLATWAAWKDSTAAARAMNSGKKKTA